jgi:LemA protein
MLYLLGLLVIIFIAIVMSSYNKLQRNSQDVREKASNVQVAISKKLSLVNQLIDVVKNYQEGEQLVQLKISQDNTNTAGMVNSYQQSGAVLASLQGMADRFPNLKANEQYNNLAAAIKESELGVQQSRENYNRVVKNYNSMRNGIPTVFVARLIGFSEAPYLQFDLSGMNDVTTLKDFKTDDGERLHQLLTGAGSKLAGATKAIAGQAGKLIGEHTGTPQEPLFYYVVPGGVPKGPTALTDIRQMIQNGTLPGEVKIAAKDSDEWKDPGEWPA